MKRYCLPLLAISLGLAGQPLHAAESISLAGDWRFALDRADAGVGEKWFERNLTNKIQLPGILQAQGYGDDIGASTPWVLTLGDAWWRLQPASLRDQFSQPGRVEVPFLSQPPKHYLGAAWYQRDIEIPAGWQGRHFTLMLERAHWQTKVWVDDQSFPANDSLVAPHLTELGALTAGKHRLSIRIDNRNLLPAQGHLLDAHSISDALGATWNGIVGKIELRAISPLSIEELQVYPQVATRSVVVRGRIRNFTGEAGRSRLDLVATIHRRNAAAQTAGGTNLIVNWSANGGVFESELSLGPDAELWDEYHPAIYRLTAALGRSDTAVVDFGLREIKASDKDILVNGREVNLRLTHFGGDFPLTGYPAMEVAAWKKIIQTCKDFGLNGIRFHSWCPPEAAFTAADEMGFYLQPECGMWNDMGSAAMQQRLNDETARILAAYGNHPSFILLSPSNEPRNYALVTPKWAAANYAQDNRRLYSAGTGWADPSQVTGGAQFATLVRFGGGELRNTSGWFGRDYRTALETVHIPVLAHEIGQWCAYPDFDVMKKFTGYLRPGNYDIFKYLADQEGVLDQNHEFAWASGRFQLACYKEEIEANLRTPGLAGYQLLDLRDYLGQGTALIGVLDAFWEPKKYVTAADYRRFAGATVPLARLAKHVFASNETLETDVEIYHFSAKAIKAAVPYWKIVDASGRAVASGEWAVRDIPIGKNIPLGRVSAKLSGLAAPAAYRLVAGLQERCLNDWNFWLYPERVEDSKSSDVLVTSAWADAERELAAGGKVLFMPAAADLDPAKCPPMKNVPIFWNIQMTVRAGQNRSPKFDAMLGLLCETNHPALAEFPTDANCDWQWIQLVNNVRSVNLASAPRTLRPIVSAIDDWNRNWRLGVIFECRVGPGRLLVSAINLDNERGGSELKQLRRSLLDYMAGDRFQPPATLTPEQVGGLWANRNRAPSTVSPARVFDPDLNDGTVSNTPPRTP